MARQKKGKYTLCFIWTCFKLDFQLHEGYQIDWSTFVSAIKQKFLWRKTAFNLKIETIFETEKETENVHLFVQIIQQSV